MLAVKSICLLPYLFKAFSRYSWIHFNLGSMHTCLLLLLSLALPKEKSQSESSVQHSSSHIHPPPLCLILLGCQCCSRLTHEQDGLFLPSLSHLLQIPLVWKPSVSFDRLSWSVPGIVSEWNRHRI